MIWSNILGICFWNLLACYAAKEVKNTTQQAQMLLNILSNGYDPSIPPNFNDDKAVEVTVQLVVLSIDGVNEDSMDYAITVYLRQSWKDERLKYPSIGHTDSSSSQGDDHKSNASNDKSDDDNRDVEHAHDHLELDVRIMQKVWYPDTFFSNERKASYHDVTVPNKLLHIFSDGTVFSSLRLSMTLTCQMDLFKYPFDTQKCPLTLSSYGFTDENIQYQWKESDAVKVLGDVELPTFEVDEWDFRRCDIVTEGGTYSCIALDVLLSRSYGFYIAQVYIPSILIVTLSWVNFWLDIDATPARTSLGLLTVLTMTTMSAGATSNLPKVSYIKAIDLWMAICLLFVFAALVEFAYVNVTSRVLKRRLSMRNAVKLAMMAKAVEEGKGNKSHEPTDKRDRARLVDKMSRIIFPSVFLCFNIFYWCFYLV